MKHTQCISEQQKYQGTLYNPRKKNQQQSPGNKGPIKQQPQTTTSNNDNGTKSISTVLPSKDSQVNTLKSPIAIKQEDWEAAFDSVLEKGGKEIKSSEFKRSVVAQLLIPIAQDLYDQANEKITDSSVVKYTDHKKNLFPQKICKYKKIIYLQ